MRASLCLYACMRASHKDCRLERIYDNVVDYVKRMGR